MLKAVLDPGVLIAALISPQGAPAEVLRRWLHGQFQLVVSPLLMDEFREVVARPKFRDYFSVPDAYPLADVLHVAAEISPDVATTAVSPADDGDTYLVNLVVASNAFTVVTGDKGLLAHRTESFRALDPRAFIELLDTVGGSVG